MLLVAGNLPTPLYGVYRERFGFSGTTLTLIFAVYTIALIPSLLAFGQLSDRVGRRPVIAGGLAVGALGLLLLAVAESTTMLLVARAVQGIALGTAVGTIPAALVELEPTGDNSRAAMATVLGQSGGSAGGPLLAGVLAQWAPAPRQLCYLVGFVLTLVAMAGVLAIREPHRPTGSWRLQKPSVPAEIREPFARAGLHRRRRVGGRQRCSCRSCRATPPTCSTPTTSRCSAPSRRQCSRRRASSRWSPSAARSPPFTRSRSGSRC